MTREDVFILLLLDGILITVVLGKSRKVPSVDWGERRVTAKSTAAKTTSGSLGYINTYLEIGKLHVSACRQFFIPVLHCMIFIVLPYLAVKLLSFFLFRSPLSKLRKKRKGRNEN